jgi:riboflavin biosynthesis pyrimidine reductase
MAAAVDVPARSPLTPLLEAPLPGARGRGGQLPHPLQARYGGPVGIPLQPLRPTVIANFVSTLDGVASYNTPEAAGGGEISGFFEPDRFVMGLLRALSDAVLIGAGTLRAAPTERWTPDFVHPDSAVAFASLRRQLGLRPQPLTTVVSGSGELDMDHPGLADATVDVLVITTDAGAEALARRGAGHVEVRSVGDRVEPADVLGALRSQGAKLVLCEGGPHLFGQLLAAHLVDELFLTLAPHLAGRSDSTPRLGLVEGTTFDVEAARWARLVDLRQAGDHLFSRYRFTEGKN